MKTRRMVEALYDALNAVFREGPYKDETLLNWEMRPKRLEQTAINANLGRRADVRLALLLEHLGLEIETVQAGERLVKAKKGRKA